MNREEINQVTRINRLMKPTNIRLRVCSLHSRDFPTLGRFYTIDIDANCVVDKNIPWSALKTFESNARELKLQDMIYRMAHYSTDFSKN